MLLYILKYCLKNLITDPLGPTITINFAATSNPELTSYSYITYYENKFILEAYTDSTQPDNIYELDNIKSVLSRLVESVSSGRNITSVSFSGTVVYTRDSIPLTKRELRRLLPRVPLLSENTGFGAGGVRGVLRDIRYLCSV